MNKYMKNMKKFVNTLEIGCNIESLAENVGELIKDKTGVELESGRHFYIVGDADTNQIVIEFNDEEFTEEMWDKVLDVYNIQEWYQVTDDILKDLFQADVVYTTCYEDSETVYIAVNVDEFDEKLKMYFD